MTKTIEAKSVFNTLCAALDSRKWTYTKEVDKLLVHYSVSGKDIPMNFVIIVEKDNKSIRVISPLPFKFPENKRVEGAVAACSASYGMVDGNFDYDVSDGSISFRLTASYRDSTVGEGLCQYMINCSCTMVEKYNDRFFALAKGILTIQDFIKEK